MYQVNSCGTYTISVKGTAINENGMNDVIDKNQTEYNKMIKEYQ